MVQAGGQGYGSHGGALTNQQGSQLQSHTLIGSGDGRCHKTEGSCCFIDHNSLEFCSCSFSAFMFLFVLVHLQELELQRNRHGLRRAFLEILKQLPTSSRSKMHFGGGGGGALAEIPISNCRLVAQLGAI